MAKPKKIRISKSLKARLQSHVKQGRKKTVYKILLKRHNFVPCFVCEHHVDEGNATLEHIVSYADGGTDDMDNLSISHEACNHRRGCIPVGTPEFEAVRITMAEKYKRLRTFEKNAAI